MRVQHPVRKGRERYTYPQQNWVVLKLDFNKTDRRGYVQEGADSILEERGDYSP